MVKKIEINMVPDIKLMEKIGATSLSLKDALIELVANSIDARADEALEVQIFLAPEEEVRIVDNGLGMDASILEEAVRLGVDMDDVVDRGKRKGMYGLGMKTACASIGRIWSVTTRPRGGQKEFFIEFDLLGLQERSLDKSDAWRHYIEERDPDFAGPLGNRESGTCISVRNLRDRHPLEGPVLDGLGRAFHPHLKGGDSITVNGRKTDPPIFNLVEGSKIEVKEAFGLEDNYEVTGWVGLDHKTHNDDFFGINIYRQGQLIQAWDKSWFRVHLMTSRVIGEVHADFLPPSFHKKGINTQSPEWKVTERHMKEYLKPLVRASEMMAKNRKDPTRQAKAVQGVQAAMGAGSAVSTALGSGNSGLTCDPMDQDSNKGEAGSEQKAIDIDATTLYLPDGPIGLTYVVEPLGEEDLPWDYIFEPDGGGELQAVLNSDSKLFKVVKDERFLGMLALSDSVAEFLVTEKGVSPREARSVRNKWLFATLS